MKILLVQPTAKSWQQINTLSLGLAYIASYLEKGGYQVACCDLGVQKVKKLPRADVVGITATTPLINEAWRVARMAKRSGAVTVLGGPHATCLPEESLKKKEVDFVVRGEGEETMLQLIQALEKGNPKDVLGLSLKIKRKIIHNPPRPLIKNLDKLPFPARHLFPPLENYTNPHPILSTKSPTANIITSRGCPFGCYFCYKGTFGQNWRARSPENVVEEWRHLVKDYKVAEIGVQDDVFNIDIKRAIKICDLIISEKLIIPWITSSGIRADLANEKLFKKMRESGCYRIAFGIESGNQKMVLEKIGKQLDLRKVRQAIKICKKLGIKTIGFFIIGHPWDTQNTVRETLDFALNSGLDYAQFAVATPIPGSKLWRLIEKHGKLTDLTWDQFDYYTAGAYFEYGKINEEFINWAKKYTWRGFYLRPKFIAKVIFDRNTWLNLPHVLRGVTHLLLSR